MSDSALCGAGASAGAVSAQLAQAHVVEAQRCVRHGDLHYLLDYRADSVLCYVASAFVDEAHER